MISVPLTAQQRFAASQDLNPGSPEASSETGGNPGRVTPTVAGINLRRLLLPKTASRQMLKGRNQPSCSSTLWAAR